MSCDKDKCIVCKTGYHAYNTKCVLSIAHCRDQDDTKTPPECIHCYDNYACLNGDKTQCINVNRELYYFVQNEDICTMEKCNVTYPNCKNCIKDKCNFCYDKYFVYEPITCIEKIQNCNRISCGCGKHFCYYCEAGPYNTMNECYAHIREKHGDYFNDPPDYKKYKGVPVSDQELREFYEKYPKFKHRLDSQ